MAALRNTALTQQKLYRKVSAIRARRKGTPIASPAMSTDAVQSEAPSSTDRARIQSLTAMIIRNGISEISAKVNAIGVLGAQAAAARRD
jgi:hypothetical protein